MLRIVPTVVALAAILFAPATTLGSEEPPVKVTDVGLIGKIVGENITFTLTLTAEPNKRHPEFALVSGDLVLDDLVEAGGRHEIIYDAPTKTYSIKWRGKSTRTLTVSFACRPHAVEDRVWREAVFQIPAAHARELKVICDRTDLEILFPGAVRFDRTVESDVLTATALLGPGRPFVVRWKPQVQQLESKLVMSSEANTIVTAGTGALRLSSLFVFSVSQGKLKTVKFTVPDDLSITQVRSSLLQDWHMEEAEGKQILAVTLSRPETTQHAIEVSSELVLGNLPTQTVLPVIEPHGVIRSSGHIALGTDSALRLLVTEPRGISQIDARGFPRMVLSREHPRSLPRANTFFYTYAAVPYHMRLAVEDIVPSFDATERLALTAREENMTIDCDLELEIRDAPLRSLIFTLDKALMVSKAEGAQVADYAVRELPGTGRQEVEVHFKEPVMGRTLISCKLEFSESALDTVTRIAAVSITGAKSERGWLAVATEQGIELEAPKTEELREVHTDSMPRRVVGAQHAYRFRKGNWSIELLPRKKKPSARAEAFHLVSIGDGIAYGSVAMTCFIAGAPLDELRFRIPSELRNVEFVSKDIRRWKQDGEIWTVNLQRKVIGDYALLVTYNQQIEADGIVYAGGVRAEGLDSQTGYICIASKLNLALQQANEISSGLLEIDRGEVPTAYLLQINAPLLKTYKYVKRHEGIRLAAKQFDAGQLVPAVIEQTELVTQINLNNEGEAQSRTTVTYKVKNSRNQFLSLSIPSDVNVWSVQLVTPTGSKRVPASFDKVNGLLMVPLDRRRNPNEPLTIEVVYAKTHGELDLSGRMTLQAAASQTRSTYTRWSVSVPQDWAVYPEPVGMPASPRNDNEGKGVAGLAAALLDGASRAVSSGSVPAATLVAGAIAAVAIFLARHLRKSAGRKVVIASVTLLTAVVGLVIAVNVNGRLSRRHCDLTKVTFAQAVDLDESTPPEVAFSIVPEWRRHATVPGTIIVPIISVILLTFAAASKRLRYTASALALTGIIYAVALFPDAWPLLVHILAWVIPAIAAAVIVKSIQASHRVPEEATALVASIVLAFVALAPRTADASEKEYPEPSIDSVEYTLKAEKDHVAIDLALHIDHDERLQVTLLSDSAILLSPDEERKIYKIDNSNGVYIMEVYRPKKRDITLQFLAPLDKSSEEGLRTLHLPIPKALRNKVVLTIPEISLDVESPTAIRLVKEEKDGVTTATAVFGPTDQCVFMWKPRARKAHLEKTAFYAEVTSLARLGLGVAECRHRIRFQVAQGELKMVKCRMPKGMTVTAVEGEEIGTWRFDPASGELEAYLTKPATGRFVITVLTQAPVDEVPYTVEIAVPAILAAERQRGSIGIATTPAVFIESEGQPSRMNIEDFVRDAAELIKASGAAASDLRGAYRVQSASDTVTVTSHEVKPEIRADESASFAVEDDRLIYNGDITIQIAKTGLFSLTLGLPKDYDVDNLVATNLSHWDDSLEGDTRLVLVHFAQKILGSVSLKLNMSQAIAQMPEHITMPRVEVHNSTKHAGTLRVSSERGVRLSVGSRAAVSEINPLELGIREQGTLAFRLLATDWKLTLNTEVVETRTVVDFLHIAHVSEGLVRHTDHLNYLLYNAGTRVFEVRVPKDVLGLEITGPDIANVKETEPGSGLWRAELSRKWFRPGVPYRLTVRYESRFNLAERKLTLEPAKAVGVDLQRGYIAAYATDKVEITPVKDAGELQPADARSIARSFGAGDLSGAAFCYTSSTPDYDLVFEAVRHDAANLLEARVQSVTMTSVVAEGGDSINKVVVDLLVGGKRHLETVLPEGAEIWSLLTDGRVSIPSYRTEKDTSVLMLPLGQSVSSELPVKLEFVYVCPKPEGWLHGRPHFVGPRFDLPLKDMEWRLYLPEGYEYEDFEGTLNVDKSTVIGRTIVSYSPDSYDARLEEQVNEENERATTLLQQGSDFANSGDQMQAKQAFENAYNWSLNKKDLNEDARIQLHKLNRQQAVVGLVGRRNKLRPSKSASPAAANQAAAPEQQMDVQQLQRIESSLGKDDSENLQLIADRMIDQQEAAAGFAWPLKVELAPRGRQIRLTGSIQVEPNADMSVDFVARKKTPTATGNLIATAVLAAAFLALGQLVRHSSAKAATPA